MEARLLRALLLRGGAHLVEEQGVVVRVDAVGNESVLQRVPRGRRKRALSLELDALLPDHVLEAVFARLERRCADVSVEGGAGWSCYHRETRFR